MGPEGLDGDSMGKTRTIDFPTLGTGGGLGWLFFWGLSLSCIRRIRRALRDERADKLALTSYWHLGGTALADI